MHPNSLANLKPRWTKDNPPPKSPGAPHKQDCVTSWLREYLLKPSKEEPAQTYEQLLARVLLSEAAKGNMQALAMVLERTEGRVPLPVQGQITGDVVFRVVYETEVKQPDGNSTG